MSLKLKLFVLMSVGLFLVKANVPIEFKITGAVYIENRFVIGSPFFHQEWMKADLKLYNGELLVDKLIKYNGLEDRFVWLNSLNYKQTLIDEFFAEEYRVKNGKDLVQTFRHLDVHGINPYLDNYQFVEVLYEGNFKLYKSHRVLPQWPQYKIVDQIRLKYDVLEYSPAFYLELADGQKYFLEKLDRRTLLKTFPQKKKEINSFLWKSKLKLRNQFDFILLFENVF